MAAPAPKQTPIVTSPESIQIRRFEMPDLSEYGPWLMERLTAAYPHIAQQDMWGWLHMVRNSNEFCFLCLPNGVALAQIMRGHTLKPRPVIQEHFVFVKDRDDKAQIADAGRFYEDFARWGKAQDAEAIVLSDLSDVPRESIQAGRMFEKTQAFLRLDK